MNLPERFKEFFVANGKKVIIPTSYRTFLHSLSKTVFVEKGEIDLFMIDLSASLTIFHQEMFLEENTESLIFLGDLLVGSSTFLYNAKEGDLLFPFPISTETPQYKAIMLADLATELRLLPSQELYSHLATSSESTAFFLHQVSKWTSSLSAFFSNFRAPNLIHHLQIGINSFEKNECAAISKGSLIECRNCILWVKVRCGELYFLGIPQIKITSETPLFPLNNHFWAISAIDSQVQVVAEPCVPDFFESGMLRFHQLIIETIAYQSQEKTTLARTAFVLRQEKEKLFLDLTLREMGSLLNDELVVENKKGGGNRLVNVCQIIGNMQNQTFIEPLQSVASTTQECLYEISVASGIYYRKVLLKNNWWNKNSGPLLGFLKDKQQRPVALLPFSTHEYKLVESIGIKGESKKIDLEISKELSREAIVFYKQFPEKEILNNKDVLRFVVKGRVQEFLTIFFSSFFALFIGLFLPFANQILFDDIIPNLDLLLFTHLLVAIGLLIISTMILIFVKEYSIIRWQSFLDHDVSAALWIRLLNLPANFFRRFTVGDLIQRISSVGMLRKVAASNVIRIVLNLVFSVAYLAAMFYYSPILALFGCGTLIFPFIGTGVCFLVTQRLESQRQGLEGILNGKVIQIIFGLSKIRTNGVENRIFSFVAQSSLKSRKLRLQIGTVNNIVQVLTNVFYSLVTLSIFFMVMQLIKEGQSNSNSTNGSGMSIGTFLAFNTAFASFSSALVDISSVFTSLVMIAPTWQRNQVLLQEPSEIKAGKLNPEILRGNVRIDHLSFRYDPNMPFVHDDLSLYANEGEFIAITGSSGCGKSSLVRLLLGFEFPEQGAIYYDGKDLAHLDLRAVRKQIGVILQNSTIMDGTIRDNITGGNLASDAQVMEAIRLAGFDEDLKLMPMGIRTCLTSGGATISGGQKQRLLIARVLLSKTRILILDEATNALDNKTQQIISQNLEKLNVTRIVIAHRLSTIRHADRIYVMDRGKIIESGTYEELSSQKGMFANLVVKQAL